MVSKVTCGATALPVRDRVRLFVPSFKRYETSEYSARCACSFVAVSVTGSSCQLGCDHCRGRMLESMWPAPTPERLWELATRLAPKGLQGLLVSGGSGKDGRVPLAAFTRVMGRIRGELGLDVVVHTGLVDEALARGLEEAKVSAAMLDVIGDEETIRGVYHLDARPADIERALDILETAGVPTAPHVVVGLDHGVIRQERAALEMLSGHSPSAVVLVVITPLAGTPMQGARPPDVSQVAHLMGEARELLSRTPLLLGCARPPGPYRAHTDMLALRSGFDGIAFPADGTVALAEQMGIATEFHEKCCCTIVEMVHP